MTTLTQRERQVVAAICRGLVEKEIARELGCAPATVKVHAKRILRKTGCRNRAQLAYQEGLARVTPDVTPADDPDS